MQLTLFRYARRRPGDPALRTKKSQVQFWMSSHSPIYLDEFPKKSPHLGASAVKKSVAVTRVQAQTSDALHNSSYLDDPTKNLHSTAEGRRISPQSRRR